MLDEFPRAMDPNNDQADVRGVVIQNDTSNDEDVVITRDASDNMTFQDGVVVGTKTLTDLLAGASLLGRAVFKVDGGLIYTTDGDVVIKETQ